MSRRKSLPTASRRLPRELLPRRCWQRARDFIWKRGGAEPGGRVNAGLTLLYWQVGDRIRREVLKEKRAGSASGSSPRWRRHWIRVRPRLREKNLRRMIQFAEAFPEADCLDAVETIGLDPLHRDHPAQDAPARVLRRDVPHRALERAHAAGTNRQPCSTSAPPSRRSPKSSSRKS